MAEENDLEEDGGLNWLVAEAPSPFRAEAESLRQRTKQFAVRVMRPCDALPEGKGARVLGSQLVRSGTSVGAHYREACRARSRAEFISKLQVALQELDETSYWFELIVEGGILQETRMQPLMEEANQLLAILTSSVQTAKSSTSTKASEAGAR